MIHYWTESDKKTKPRRGRASLIYKEKLFPHPVKDLFHLIHYTIHFLHRQLKRC